MAASITFDFLSRGAGQLQGDVRKIGDNTVLAARGARVLSDAIEKLGRKEDRTAAESKILAGALRQTGDAEDRVAARAVLADAAIRRLDDAIKDSAGDSGKASGEAVRLAKALDGLKGKGGPAFLGPALALAPALASLGGVAAGAGAALGGAFIAGAGALAAFGAIAKPVLTDAGKAAGAVAKAQDAYNAAITSGVPRARAYKAEQLAIAKAYAGMSPQQIALSKQLGTMADAWDKVKAAQTPVVAGALQPWLRSVTDLTKNLPPVIAKIAPVIKDLGGQFDNLVNSSAFRGFRDFIGSTGAAAVSAGGSTVIDLVKSFMILLPRFDPLIREAVGWIARLGPAVLTWASSKKASDDIMRFMQWFSQNGPAVGGFLKSIGGALAALVPGLTSGGLGELHALTVFLDGIKNLPPAVAKPLFEVAGALLLLNKTGVLKVGIKIIGPAVKWLTGGLINIGGGAAVGAEIRAAFASGGAAAAAEIRAAMAGGGAAAGAGTAAGGAGAGAAAGRAAGGGFLAGLSAAVGPALSGVLGGLLIRAVGDTLSPKGTFAGRLNAQLQQIAHTSGGIFSVNLLHSFTFGGLEAWMTTHFGQPVGGFLNRTTGFLSGSWGKFTGFLSGSWNQTWSQITGRAATGSRSVGGSLAAAGRSADTLRTRNLVPLQGEFGRVTGGIQGLAGIITGTMLGALRAAGARSDEIRTRNLVPLRGEVGRVTGGIQGLQRSINAMHGKTVNVGVHASGSGGMTFTQKVAASISSGGFSLRSLAGGGLVRAGSGPAADDVPAMLSRGELVVPAYMVKAGLADHLRGMIPGFAGGGIAGMTPFAADAEYGFGRAVESALLRAEFANLKKAVAAAAKAKAAAAAQPFGPLGDSGARSGSAALAQAFARSIMWQYHWGPEQWPPWLYLGNQESGWNAYAVNPSSGAYGIGQSLGHGHPYNLGDYKTQVIWMANYIRGRYGNPAAAWAHERAFNWYAGGGLVGSVPAQGAAYLKAWQSRHGGGFGAAWAPVVVNEQIARMAAAAGRARTLAGAGGLSAGQHRYWTALAADEKKRLGVLIHERDAERAWRAMLGASDVTLAREIAAAGKAPGLAGPVRGWKAQIARQKGTIAAISKMLGYSDAQRAAIARAHPPAKPPAPTGVLAAHTYGGDVADTTGAFLASAAAPFGAARGGLVFDRGGWLKPGWNPPMLNNTGRPEHLVPARSGGKLELVVSYDGSMARTGLSQQQLTDIRYTVKTVGGGSVERAFGAH